MTICIDNVTNCQKKRKVAPDTPPDSYLIHVSHTRFCVCVRVYACVYTIYAKLYIKVRNHLSGYWIPI
jgi:hypothetical protein